MNQRGNRQRRHSNQPRPKPKTTKAVAKEAPPKVARPTQLPLPLHGAELTRFEMTQVEHHSGPLPAPEVLARYDEVMPGLAGDIVQMAKDEQAFRHRLVDRAVDANIALERRGQHYALIIALVGLIVGALVAIFGNPIAGGLIGGGSLATIIGLFLRRGSDEKKDDEPEQSS